MSMHYAEKIKAMVEKSLTDQAPQMTVDFDFTMYVRHVPVTPEADEHGTVKQTQYVAEGGYLFCFHVPSESGGSSIYYSDLPHPRPDQEHINGMIEEFLNPVQMVGQQKPQR